MRAGAFGTDAAPLLGELVGSKYRVEEIIGAGGMSIVCSATHIHLGTSVAIKFVAQKPPRVEATARLLREARMVARMTSQHVVRVLDVGVSWDDAPFIVMELLRGEDLGAVLRSQGRLSVHEAIGHIAQACEAVAEAHALGIVHRDIKPSNLFLTRDAAGRTCVKVLDFGVAKLGQNFQEDAADFSFTRSDAMIGSPLYMAPEQAASPKSVDERADIWGLGVALWQLLTGEPAFQAENLASIVVKTATAELPDLCVLRADVPAELRDVIAECLKKLPSERLASATLLRERLLAILRAETVPPPRQRASDAKDELGPVAVNSARTLRHDRRQLAWLAAGMLVGTLALGARQPLARLFAARKGAESRQTAPHLAAAPRATGGTTLRAIGVARPESPRVSVEPAQSGATAAPRPRSVPRPTAPPPVAPNCVASRAGAPNHAPPSPARAGRPQVILRCHLDHDPPSNHAGLALLGARDLVLQPSAVLAGACVVRTTSVQRRRTVTVQ